MKKTTTSIYLTMFLLSSLYILGPAQTILYEEHFTGGVAQLTWYAGFNGDTIKAIATTGNPSGDGWVGALANKSSGGSVGMSYAGTKTLSNYSIEAQIFLNAQAATGGPFQGLVAYRDTAGGLELFYGLIADFDADKRLMLRRYRGATPTAIKIWTAAEIPGGAPAAPGWQKLKLEVADGKLWAYYNDNLLPGSPYMDTTYKAGFFGGYYFNMADQEKSTLFDDIIVRRVVTSVDEGSTPNVLSRFALQQNYPNPFNPETRIAYQLPVGSFVSLVVHDLLGREIRTLVSEEKSSGSYTVTWNGKDELGNTVSAGVYLYTLKAGNFVESKKMILMK
jgi:hypothetical protein